MNKHACVIVIYSIFAHMCVFVHLLINLFYFIFYGGTDHPPYKVATPRLNPAASIKEDR